MPLNAIVIDLRDNVATSVRPLKSGDTVSLIYGNQTVQVNLLDDIPFGHKFSLTDIETGSPVIKYGEKIGLATRKIRPGEHVHVHNVEGNKGRGDRL